MRPATEKAHMIHARPAPEEQTISLPISTVRDRRLSPETRGALVLLLTEPDRRRLPDLLMAQGIGQTRACRIIRELRGAGYLRVHAARKRPDGTQAGWWYELSDRPDAFSTAE